MLQKRKKTIFRKIFIPIIFIMIIQSAIFYIATVYGGILDTLNKNAEEILAERVINRKNEIETTFHSFWSNISGYDTQFDSLYNSYTDNGSNPFYNDNDAQKKFLSDSSSIIIDLLRTNKVNGAFIILNGDSEYKDYTDYEKKEQTRYGLCIRDYDVTSLYSDKEDLVVVRCPVSMINTIGCSLETWWDATYTFDADNACDYYYEPLKAAYNNPGVESDDLAYFSTLHNFQRNDKQIISYSIPLIDSNGYPYGVLGIELTTDYLVSLIPSKELYGQNVGSYGLISYNEDNVSDVSCKIFDGILYKRAFGETSELTLNYINESDLFKIDSTNNMSLIGIKKDIRIYNRNTPFERNHVALIGVVEKSNLYSVSYSIRKVLFSVSFVVLIIGAVSILIVSKRFAAPIIRLSKKVSETDSDSEYNLEKLNIIEIDKLITSIENMSKGISENHARTEFFSRMSHDMRTPMNAIIGFSSPDILENATEKQKDEYLEKINGSGKYLLGLINEILDITKIDSGKMELHNTNICMNDIFNDIIPIIKEVSEEKNIEFITQFIGDKNLYINGDAQRLKQIFLNLLSNAVKFTNANGQVIFSVSALCSNHEKVTYKISIKDNGIGMSEDFLKRMYTPFQQEYTGKEGTGLGLSIVQKLVDLMNGTIQCESNKGQGTEFTILLTYMIVEKEEVDVAINSEKNIDIDSILNGRRILLCEDHPMNQQIALQLLKKKGMEVDIADNGQIGLLKFSDSDIGYYSAILMDIRMPVMNGLEATKAIRKLDRKDAADIPIIAMTANAFQSDVDDCIKAGMNKHLPKPFQPLVMYNVLAEWIDNYDKCKKQND